MKKVLIGSIIGGLIIFIWQFLSFALINFHKPVQAFTDKDKAILAFLNDQGLKEGGYILPGMPEGATMDEHQNAMKEAEGKPWASIQYHEKWENNMVMNMIRGLLVDIIMVALFCWILRRLNVLSFNNIVIASLITGLIVFLNAHYTNFIWYQTFDIWAHLLDAVVSWGLTGLWLAWWLRRGTNVSTRRI